MSRKKEAGMEIKERISFDVCESLCKYYPKHIALALRALPILDRRGTVLSKATFTMRF